jgi:Lon protease-like protein
VATQQRISLFPLPRALLFPGMQLPLHIFEPRYRALVSDAMARDRRIGMIQPKGDGPRPALYEIGCVGHIGNIEAMDDGRYNIVLTGVARFRVLRELDVTTPFRQVEAMMEAEDKEPEILAPIERAALEQEARRFADAHGYAVDWTSIARLDDESLVNGIAQVVPFDVAAKQALLEAPTLGDRADKAIQLMQFFKRVDDDGPSTLQ